MQTAEKPESLCCGVVGLLLMELLINSTWHTRNWETDTKGRSG